MRIIGHLPDFFQCHVLNIIRVPDTNNLIWMQAIGPETGMEAAWARLDLGKDVRATIAGKHGDMALTGTRAGVYVRNVVILPIVGRHLYTIYDKTLLEQDTKEISEGYSYEERYILVRNSREAATRVYQTVHGLVDHLYISRDWTNYITKMGFEKGFVRHAECHGDVKAILISLEKEGWETLIREGLYAGHISLLKGA